MWLGQVNTPTENVHYFIKPRPSSTDPSTANLPTIATLSQYKQFGSLTMASRIAPKQGVRTQFNIIFFYLQEIRILPHPFDDDVTYSFRICNFSQEFLLTNAIYITQLTCYQLAF
ncbi:PREDICTED: uncharacterized protein LOC105154847 [Acromyrmex echinatior]|uniref:uncharacterized protein LOC105154847 n=1 Tax=Acromyrmex echinatior TaxID=103372 RepID=UPI000580C98F|nr:PREDICTED: uncharacterized protein LOC105154847 [Acromyrmex echinatior]